MRGFKIVALVATLIMSVAACGDDDGGITVEDTWARTSPKVATNGAAYMKITSDTDDALVGAAVPSDIADHAEVHEVVMDADGAMMMQQTEKVELPAGETVSLQPGGYHVMLIELVDALEIGQTFDVTLEFESGATKTVSVEVTEEDPNA